MITSLDRALAVCLATLPARHQIAARQFAGYVAVSGVAWLVDVAIYWTLLKPVGVAALAAVGGYLAGVATHYALSSRIVFRTALTRRGVTHEAPVVARFLAAGAVGLVLTAAIVGILADGLGVHPLIAKLVATGASFLGVFLALKALVFRPSSEGATMTVAPRPSPGA